MNRAGRTLFVILAFTILFIAILSLTNQGDTIMGGGKVSKISVGKLSQYLQKPEEIDKIVWQQSEITGTLTDGSKFNVRVPDPNSPVAQKLFEDIYSKVPNFQWEGPPAINILFSILSVVGVPILILVLLWIFLARQAQIGGNQALSFGRSRAKRVGENSTKVTFEDVAGIDEAKQELFEIVDFLKNTKKYTALGAKIPKGILLTGPPGVGKTYLARAIAGEAGVPFFHISGSDFVEMFVGVGAARVRDLFETAKAHRPSLIFVDEIDAVGRQRGAGLGGGHDEREQTLNQLLVEMDGFDPNSGVILIAATNRPDVLDPAILRPGRFDRQIVVDVPDAKGRESILKIHAKGKPLEQEMKLDRIARRTPGFTGADLANMLNEAALLAARRNHSKIQYSDIEEALDRVVAGPQRKSKVLDPHEREVIAYHEAGHAIVGELLEHSDPVHKVTILPRGMSLGSTWAMPEDDKYLVTEQELLDDVATLLGGRVAEEIVFNEITTGASNDLQRVTQIARAMVCDYGMSEKLGTMSIGRRNHNPFLGRDYTMDERNYSEEVARLIDEEVRHIVESSHRRAEELLTANRDKLDRVVQALLEHETLDREEFLAVMEGRPLPARKDSGGTSEKEGLAESGVEKSKPAVAPPRLEPGPA